MVAFVATLLYLIKSFVLDPLFLSPLSSIPGPKPFALTRWRLAYEDWNATRTRTIKRLHSEYGPAVRIGPNEVSFNSLTALRTIYGPGSRFGRTGFYRMFDVYGEQNLFTFHSTKDHGQRKKLLSHAYAKSVVLKEPTTRLVEEKARQYLKLIESEPQGISDRPDGLNDNQMASECADHFLAGIDTTSDTLMFLVWALSLPENEQYQAKLRDEVLSLPKDALNEHGYPKADAADRCTYLQAVIKETLRLYAPLPSTEPRSVGAESVVDGYSIPADTVVGMSPYIIHRNPEVFKNPLVFNPDRWLGPDAVELNRHFWAFSSGGRMCIGMQ
ncbi:hypothetical protein ACHAQA_003963 [Verticillium albo-atrum]